MKRNSLVLWMSFLLLLGMAAPMSAQDDACGARSLGNIDGLLAQAQAALGSGEIATAITILSDVRTLLAPCIGGNSTSARTPFTAVTRNSDWTPVVQSIDGVEMVQVPVGCFAMGSTIGSDREVPVHQICFDEPFWIDRYEVSNAQYHRSDEAWANNHLPVVDVTWVDAWEFCIQRGMRLPSEAQWEYAARGPDALTFPWGNEFVWDNLAHRGNTSQIVEVDRFPEGASWVGAFNMSGNVKEWTSTLHMPYPYDAADGRELITSDGSPRVIRGGSYYEDEYFLRSAERFGANTSNYNFNIGFRCARPYSDAE